MQWNISSIRSKYNILFIIELWNIIFISSKIFHYSYWRIILYSYDTINNRNMKRPSPFTKKELSCQVRLLSQSPLPPLSPFTRCLALSVFSSWAFLSISQQRVMYGHPPTHPATQNKIPRTKRHFQIGQGVFGHPNSELLRPTNVYPATPLLIRYLVVATRRNDFKSWEVDPNKTGTEQCRSVNFNHLHMH